MFLRIIFVLLCASPLSAQVSYPVTITVTDAETGEKMPFVNIQVTNSPQGGTTDLDGIYTLNLKAGRETLLVSFLGYDLQRNVIEVEGAMQLSYALQPTAELLETVTVSSNDASTRLARPLMGVERLSAEKLTSLPVVMGEVDVFKGLQLVSGVNSAGEASNGLSVRGGTIDQNLVVLDGAPVFTPTHLFGLFSVFTPDALGSVDLYRANIPARFGGRIASVVDVKTSNPTADKFKMRGGIGLVSSRLGIETPLTKNKKLKLLAAGRVGLNDFIFKAFERLKNTESKFVDGILKLRYAPNDNNLLTVSSFYSNDVYRIDLINSFAGITATSNRFNYSTLNGTLDWLRLFGDRTSLSTQLVSGDHRPGISFPQRDTEFEIKYRSRIRYLSFQSAVDHRTASGHQLMAGIQLARYTLEPGSLEPGGSPSVGAVELDQERALEMSLFVEDEWKPFPDLTVSAGLRYTRFLQRAPGELRIYAPGVDRSFATVIERTNETSGTLSSYGGFEPRLGMSWQLSEVYSLKAAYARNRQYLQNIFNSTSPLPSSRWKVADNNILPQRGDLFSLGLYRLINGGTYEFSVEGYYRAIDNLLEYKPGADFFLSTDVETDLIQGEGRAYGVEFGLQKSAGKFTGNMNYTYSKAENRVPGPSLTTRINDGDWYNGYFDQPHTFNTNFTFDDGITHKVSLNFVVQSNRPYSRPNGFINLDGKTLPIFLERNNARLPVYHRLDLSWTIHNARMKKTRWTGDWTVTIYNLYGRKNAYNIYYQPREGGNNAEVFGSSPLASYQISIFGAPIFSLAYSFKFE